MTLHSLRGHLIYVAPLRLGLGVAWLLIGLATGVPSAGALGAFAGGLFMTVFLMFNDPRAAFLQRREAEPLPSDGFVFASPLRQALSALFPSTAGLSVLAAIAVVPQPVLSVLLGGISAGLGVSALLNVPRADPTLWYDRRTGRLYRR
jgi:hypothetical protein